MRYAAGEAYVLCTMTAATFEYPRATDQDTFDAPHRLARWLHKQSQVKIARIYPASGEAIVVCKSAADAATLATLDKSDYAGTPIQVSVLGNAGYNKMRGSVARAGNKWSWKVMFPSDDSFEWDQEKADDDDASKEHEHEHDEAGGCCGDMRGGVANNQFRHPVAGHLMCIACMNPIEADDFNVCKPCGSGIARPMWGASPF